MKNEVAELYWEENLRKLGNLKNELLQNQRHHHQQQAAIPDSREIKHKLNDLENRRRRNNLSIDGIIEEENESWAQSEKDLQDIIKDRLHFDHDTEIELVQCSGKKQRLT